MTQQADPQAQLVHSMDGLVYVAFDDGHEVVLVPYKLEAKPQHDLRNFQLFYECIQVAQFNARCDKLVQNELIMCHSAYSPTRLAYYWEQAVLHIKAVARADRHNGDFEYADMVAKKSRKALEALQNL